VSAATIPPIRFRVSSATLFESTPSPHGSTYRALLTVQLQTDNL
jgi:hypothetical protein